jgi:hypothetical protein
MKHSAILLATIAVALSATTAVADILSTEAFDNATVRPTGPRTGTSGKNFFNVEGSANGVNASYGVADFDFGVQANTVTALNGMSLALTQDNAAFTHDGILIFSLDTKDPGSDIQPVTSPLIFDGADPGTATDSGQGDLALLTLGGGPFMFVTVATGTTDTYTFTPSAAVQAEIVSRLNSHKPIRIVVGTGDAAVAATCSGFSNANRPGPTLTLDVTTTVVAVTPSTWEQVKSLYRGASR